MHPSAQLKPGTTDRLCYESKGGKGEGFCQRVVTPTAAGARAGSSAMLRSSTPILPSRSWITRSTCTAIPGSCVTRITMIPGWRFSAVEIGMLSSPSCDKVVCYSSAGTVARLIIFLRVFLTSYISASAA